MVKNSLGDPLRTRTWVGLGKPVILAADTGFITNAIYFPTHSKLHGRGKIQPEVHSRLILLFFSNQIGLAGHSSAALPLAMLFYFNGTSFVKPTRKASGSCSEPDGHESSPNWERGLFRGTQNLR